MLLLNQQWWLNVVTYVRLLKFSFFSLDCFCWNTHKHTFQTIPLWYISKQWVVEVDFSVENGFVSIFNQLSNSKSYIICTCEWRMGKSSGGHGPIFGRTLLVSYLIWLSPLSIQSIHKILLNFENKHSKHSQHSNLSLLNASSVYFSKRENRIHFTLTYVTA